MENMYSRTIHAIALFLCMTMLLLHFSLPVEAIETIRESTSVTMNPDVVTVVSEDTTKRDMYTKHFLCSDGLYRAVCYPDAVHYYTGTEWKNIDNRLKYNSVTGNYETANNPGFHASFSASAQSLLTMSAQKEQAYLAQSDTTNSAVLSHGIIAYSNRTELPMTVAENNIRPVVSEKATDVSPIGKDISDPDTFSVTNTTDKITYPGLLGNGKADVEYIVSQNKVREKIILHEGNTIDSFVFTIPANGMTAEVQKDGSVILVNAAGKTMYTVARPELYDAADMDCFDVEVTVTKQEDSVYIAYEMDKDWLFSEEREFPVVFSPTVLSSSYSTNVVDTYYIQREGMEQSYGSRLRFGCQEYAFTSVESRLSKYHALIQFMNISSMLPYETFDVSEISLNLHMVSANSGKNISMYDVTTAWRTAEGGVSGAPYVQSKEPARGKFVTTTNFAVGKLNYSFDLYNSGLRQALLQHNSNLHYGFKICYENDTSDIYAENDPNMVGTNDINAFWSINYSETSCRPVLNVTYRVSHPYSWPLSEEDYSSPYTAYKITSYWGYRGSTDSFHNGVDVGVTKYVFSMAEGVVTHIDTNHPIFGNRIVIIHPSGYCSSYQHLSRINPSVGETVTQGQLIGTAGNTGLSTGTHLHFEVWYSLRYYDDGNGHEEIAGRTFNPLPDYNSTDKRAGITNPNPLFLDYVEDTNYPNNVRYIRNPNFDFNFYNGSISSYYYDVLY